jgi:myo-inositol-1(or 4)-monophosphatase
MSQEIEILEEISVIARQAGDIALKTFGRIDPELKDDRSFVTDTDRRVEEFIREQLLLRFPADGIIGEEFQPSNARDSEYTWAIDPIDGTTNYVHGLPHWAVCIGRVNASGTPDLGVVYLPAQEELYSAATGHGATMNGRTLRMVSRDYPENEQLLAIWSSAFREISLDFAGKVRVLGSTIVKFLYLARGSYIGSLTPMVHVWDVAAGFPILWEAGGESRTLTDGSRYTSIDLDPEKGFEVPPLVLALPELQDKVRSMVTVLDR